MLLDWVDDLFAKKRLEDFGVEFTEKTVALGDIDWNASRTNGARLNDPLNEELKEEYKTAMARGDRFPKIVVFETKGAKPLVIAGGNHRGHAAKDNGVDKVPAYVVKTNDKAVLDLLPRVFNRDHGKRMDRDEAIQHAMYAVDTYGFEPKKAEEAFGLSKGTVSSELRVRAVKRLLEKNNIKAAVIPKSSLKYLSGLNNDNVALHAGRITIDGRLGSEQVCEMVKEVRKNKTEASQIGKLAEYEKKIGVAKNPGPPTRYERNVRTKFLTWLTTGENYLEGIKHLSQLQITEESERKSVKQRLDSLCDRVQSIVAPRGAHKSNGRAS